MTGGVPEATAAYKAISSIGCYPSIPQKVEKLLYRQNELACVLYAGIIVWHSGWVEPEWKKRWVQNSYPITFAEIKCITNAPMQYIHHSLEKNQEMNDE